MESKRIKVLAQIPSDSPQLRKISYRFVDGQQSHKVTDLPVPVDSKLIFTPKELANALKQSLPDIGNYRYDEWAGNENVFVLHPLVDGKWPLFKINLELHYANQKIVSYRQDIIEINESADEKEQQVLSASKALGNLIENFPAGGLGSNEH